MKKNEDETSVKAEKGFASQCATGGLVGTTGGGTRGGVNEDPLGNAKSERRIRAVLERRQRSECVLGRIRMELRQSIASSLNSEHAMQHTQSPHTGGMSRITSSP